MQPRNALGYLTLAVFAARGVEISGVFITASGDEHKTQKATL